MKRLLLLIVVLGLSLTPSFGQLEYTIAVRVDTTRQAPVLLDGDTLFIIHAGLVNLPAEHRAEVVSDRIAELAQEPGTPLDSVTIKPYDAYSEISVGDRFITAVYDADAAVAGTTRDSVGRAWLAAVRHAVQNYRDERSARTLVTGILLSLGATVLLAVLLRLLFRLRRGLTARLLGKARAIALGTHEIVKADWISGIVAALVRLLSLVIALILVYMYFQFVLTRFVWTRTFALMLLDMVFDPLRALGEGLLSILPNIIFILVLVFVVRYMLRGFRLFFNEVAREKVKVSGFYADWAMPTYKIVRVLVIAFALVIAYPYIPGSSSPAFQGISLFAGLLLSLGSTSIVANMVAGLVMTYMRGFRVGAVVKINETVGMVVSSSVLVTRVRTPKNVEITIPNSLILGTHITNYSTQAENRTLILPTTVTIGYDAPWRQVHALLRTAAGRTPGVLKDPPPFVLQRSLDDFYVTYELNIHIATAVGMLEVLSSLHKNIQDAFNEHGVQIMSPNYEADRAGPTVVPKSKWYEPPAPKPGEPEADT